MYADLTWQLVVDRQARLRRSLRRRNADARPHRHGAAATDITPR